MKFITLLALACAVLFFGCKKNDYTEANTMKYTIGGLSDITMKFTDSASLPLAIKYTSGLQERLTLYVDGLPAGTTASYYTASGTPDFATILHFNTNNAPGGSYNIKIIGTPASGTSTSYDMMLNIKSKAEIGCADDVAGIYTAVFKGDYSGTVLIDAATIGKNQVRFKNQLCGDFTGELDCDGKKITIKSQGSSLGNYVSGSGTFTTNGINLQMYNEDDKGFHMGEFTINMVR